jgi:DNA-binding MarR family transcriptional regulator
VSDPSDRRSPVIELTPRGTRVVNAARKTFRRAFTDLLVGPVDDDSLASLLGILGRLRGQFTEGSRRSA